jgi:hypothetical protein
MIARCVETLPFSFGLLIRPSVVKINLKKILRQLVVRPSVSSYLNALVEELNTLLGYRANSQQFWTQDIKLQITAKYGLEALTESEREPAFHLGLAMLLSDQQPAARTTEPPRYFTKDYYLRMTLQRIQTLMGMNIRSDIRWDGLPPRALSSLLPSYLDPETLRVKHASTGWGVVAVVESVLSAENRYR